MTGTKQMYVSNAIFSSSQCNLLTFRNDLKVRIMWAVKSMNIHEIAAKFIFLNMQTTLDYQSH